MQLQEYLFRTECDCESYKSYKCHWTMDDCMDAGTPICPECGDDMELVGIVVTEDLKNLRISLNRVLELVEGQSIVGDNNSLVADDDRQSIKVVRFFMESIESD